MKCFVEECYESPIVYYACDMIYYICASHITHHQLISTETNHKLSLLKKTIPKENISEFVAMMTKAISKFNSAKKDLIDLHRDLSDLVQKSIVSISEITKTCRKIIKDIISSTTIIMPITNDERFSESELNSKMISLYIKDLTFKLNLSTLFDNISDIREEYRNKNKYYISSKILYIPYFKKNTNILYEFNVQTRSNTIKIYENIKNYKDNPCLCYINSELLFVCGGNNEISVPAYILNTYTLEIQNFSPGISKINTIPIIFYKRVYIFGFYLKNNLIFKLDEKKFYSITDLPKSSTYLSTVKVKKTILISGNNSFLQFYNGENNSFIDKNPGFDIKDSNLVLKYKGCIYVLLKGGYRAKDHYLEKFDFFKLDIEFGCIVSRPVIYKSKAYFVNSDRLMHVLNFKDLSLKKIS